MRRSVILQNILKIALFFALLLGLPVQAEQGLKIEIVSSKAQELKSLKGYSLENSDIEQASGLCSSSLPAAWWKKTPKRWIFLCLRPVLLRGDLTQAQGKELVLPPAHEYPSLKVHGNAANFVLESVSPADRPRFAFNAVQAIPLVSHYKLAPGPGNPRLTEDRPVVEAFVHLVDGDTAFRIVLVQRPEERLTAAVPRKDRRVVVNAPVSGRL